MIGSAPGRRAAITPHNPTAPSPTTTTVEPLPTPTPAASAVWCPVPMTSDKASRLANIATSGNIQLNGGSLPVGTIDRSQTEVGDFLSFV